MKNRVLTKFNTPFFTNKTYKKSEECKKHSPLLYLEPLPWDGYI